MEKTLSPEAAAINDTLIKILRTLLEVLVYCPEHMHGLPTKTYKTRAYKRLVEAELRSGKKKDFKIMSLGELIKSHKDLVL